MAQPNLTFNCADVARDLSAFTVGFATLHVHDRTEDAIAAGSGTLVTIGSIAGILTAAHVLQNLPNRGEVALLLFPGNERRLQKQTIDMALADKVMLAAATSGSSGPDLGFLRLPEVNIKNLRATNSFFNISDKRDGVARGQPRTTYTDAVLGVVEEWTKDAAPVRLSTRLKTFNLLFCGGDVTSKWCAGPYDLCTFTPSFEDGIEPPKSYGGVSGGGLWRVYFEPDGSNKVHERRLIGVAFYEIPDAEGNKRINCHGPLSVYDHLIETIRARWPERA
jgi:hypothetical protein